MRAAITLATLATLLVSIPASASGRPPFTGRIYVFPLHQFRAEIYWPTGMNTVSMAQYGRWRGKAVAFSTTAYSNRRGAQAGLRIDNGYVHQGTFRKRCILHVDQSGRHPSIGYVLPTDLHDAFEAGPCIIRLGSHGLYIAEREERFNHSFVTARTERFVFCLDRGPTAMFLFRFRDSVWSIADAVARSNVDRCINLDGGSQAKERARQPAVLGILVDPFSTGGP